MRISIRTAIMGTIALTFAFPASAQEAQPETLKVAIGQRGNWETAAAELGQNAGFFKKRGIVLELLYTQGSAETQQAVISGSVDIGVGLGTTSVMGAYAKGAPLRAIGNQTTGSAEFWFVPAASPIRSMKDVDGKTVAFATVGSSSNLIVRAFMRTNAVAGKPVATGGPAQTLVQVMSGQIDVGWSAPPFGLDAAREGKIRIIARGRDLPEFRDQTIRLLAVNAEVLARRQDTVARFVQAYRDTVAWMYGTDAGLKAYALLAQTSEENVKEVRETFFAPPSLDVDTIVGLDQVMADGVTAKFLPAPLTKEQLADLFRIPPRMP